MNSAIPNSEVAIGRRMNGSETLMAACSRPQNQTFRRRVPLSWLRLRSARRRLARLRRHGSLLIALTLTALALLAAALAVLALPFLLALNVPAAAPFMRREIGRRCLSFTADDDLCAIGQVGKTRRHHRIERRQSVRDHRVGFVLLGHRNRFCRDD